jgi:hypothetical protein
MTAVVAQRPTLWQLFTPAVNELTGEVDHDRLMQRTHVLFFTTFCAIGYLVWNLCRDPTPARLVLLLLPVVILVIVIEIDERSTERKAQKIKNSLLQSTPPSPKSTLRKNSANPVAVKNVSFTGKLSDKCTLRQLKPRTDEYPIEYYNFS